jgi:hypothetical protein
MTVEELLKRQQPRRKVQGIAAALLPYEPDGRVAVDAFAKQLTSTHRAGLRNAVNMDTGYVNYLSDTEKQDVLSWTRQALGNGVPFVAGAYIENQAGDDIILLYRRQIDTIVRFGGMPILFQTARLHGQPPAKIAEVYREVCRPYPQALAFELGPMFAPNGEIWNAETIQRLMDIPAIKGMKHSSLAAKDVNHHPSAINVADLQASQLRVPNTGGIEGHEDRSMKWRASRIDELGYFFLTENGG